MTNHTSFPKKPKQRKVDRTMKQKSEREREMENKTIAYFAFKHVFFLYANVVNYNEPNNHVQPSSTFVVALVVDIVAALAFPICFILLFSSIIRPQIYPL